MLFHPNELTTSGVIFSCLVVANPEVKITPRQLHGNTCVCYIIMIRQLSFFLAFPLLCILFDFFLA